MAERLNKVIARAGVASRRGADELIEQGRVTVNGAVAEVGAQVEPEVDEIRVDGELIHPERVPDRYIALYKPRHVISTANDPYDRPIVTDLVDAKVRLFPVGRLDAASEGLLLLTNDGELANQLTHPRYEHEREYRVKISGTPLEPTLQKWREGMWLEEGRTLPAEVTVESSTGAATWLRFVLREGKNRQIRRMVEAFNHEVHRLIRTRMGPITLGNLKPGEWRRLTPKEIDALHAGSDEPIYLDSESDPTKPGKSDQEKKYKKGWARPKSKRQFSGRKKRSNRR
ncbi:MAG: rRNA pseudouridine synthase [Chloroflexota bacterium]|nr:rRNA pseudouridine synthase [Chloroflexota bacterium]